MAETYEDSGAGKPPALPLDDADPSFDRYAPPVPPDKPAVAAAPEPETGLKAKLYPDQPTVLPDHGDEL